MFLVWILPTEHILCQPMGEPGKRPFFAIFSPPEGGAVATFLIQKTDIQIINILSGVMTL